MWTTFVSSPSVATPPGSGRIVALQNGFHKLVALRTIAAMAEIRCLQRMGIVYSSPIGILPYCEAVVLPNKADKPCRGNHA